MITILCSNYNSEKWINKYLNSINNQDLNNFEINFVDANSSDSYIVFSKIVVPERARPETNT